MINPNKNYNAHVLATIIKIDDPNSYIPYLTLKTDCGRIYEGDLKRSHSQWNKLKVGDRVGFTGRFSITMDKFMVSTVTRKRIK